MTGYKSSPVLPEIQVYIMDVICETGLMLPVSNSKDMTESSDGGKPRDGKSGRLLPETDIQEILDILDDNGGVAKTSTVADELDYTLNGALKRLRKTSDYVEEDRDGRGSSSLWRLKYEKKDFLYALEKLGDLTPTEKIAEEVGCEKDVAYEWLCKLEKDDDVIAKDKGDDYLWSKLEK